MRDYVLGTSDFVKLPARSVIDQSLTLPRNQFSAFGGVGLHTITYLFLSGRYPRDPAPADLWQRQVYSAALNLLVRSPAAKP